MLAKHWRMESPKKKREPKERVMQKTLSKNDSALDLTLVRCWKTTHGGKRPPGRPISRREDRVKEIAETYKARRGLEGIIFKKGKTEGKYPEHQGVPHYKENIFFLNKSTCIPSNFVYFWSKTIIDVIFSFWDKFNPFGNFFKIYIRL